MRNKPGQKRQEGTWALGSLLPLFLPPLSDRSPPGATRCATPAALAAAQLKEPLALLPAPASARSPTDAPHLSAQVYASSVATRRPSSTSARIMAYHMMQSSPGHVGVSGVGAGCVRLPIVAAEHPPPVADAPAQKSPHALCDVVWSGARALQPVAQGLWVRCSARELHAWMCMRHKGGVGSTQTWHRRGEGFCCACDAARPACDMR